VADIAAGDTGEQLAGLRVTEGDNEPVDAMVLAIDDGLANGN